jgi:hypothetical protein
MDSRRLITAALTVLAVGLTGCSAVDLGSGCAT